MTVVRFLHPRGETLEYHMDWTEWLAGETIVSSTWHATGDVTLSQETWTAAITSVWAAGGTPGELRLRLPLSPDSILTNDIVTSSGRDSTRHADDTRIPHIELFMEDRL